MNIAIALLAAAVTLADVPVMPDQYVLLCEGEKANGLDWRGGTWVEAKFKPDRYLVSKLPTNKCFNVKQSTLTTLGDGDASVSSKDVCLNVRDFGSEYMPVMSAKCTEFYVFDKAGVWNKSFSCDNLFANIRGRFDGWFHRATVHGDTRGQPPKDYKDSMLIEVGKCGQIS